MHNNGIVVFGEDTDFGKPKKDMSGGEYPTTPNNNSSSIEDNSDDDYYDDDIEFNIEPLAPQQVVASDEDLAMFEASIPVAVRRPVNINYADLIAQSEQVYATNNIVSNEDAVFSNSNGSSEAEVTDVNTNIVEELEVCENTEVSEDVEVDEDVEVEVSEDIEVDKETPSVEDTKSFGVEEPKEISSQSELVYDSEDSLYTETKYKSDNIIRDYEEDNAYHYPLIYLSGEGVEQYRIQALGGMLDNRSFIDTDEIHYNVYIELPDGVIFVGKLLSKNLRILLNNRTFDVFDKKVYLDEDTKYEGDMLYALSEISPTILD